MIFIDTYSWSIALLFGSIMVFLHALERFDEPSYNVTREYFKRYKPRFSTSRARYRNAKLTYTVFMLALYLVFSSSPDILALMTGGAVADSTGAALPLAVAVALTSLQNIPLVKDFEKQTRGFLHAAARIPEGVRDLVAQLKGSSFNFPKYLPAAMAEEIGGGVIHNGMDSKALLGFLETDPIVRPWFKVSCLLRALSSSNRQNLAIDDMFFAHYNDEIESIHDRYKAYNPLVKIYLEKKLSGEKNTGEVDISPAALKDIQCDLRDRVYTFLACALCSSSNDNAEIKACLRNLGFASRPVITRPNSPTQFLTMSVMLLTVASVVTAFLTIMFQTFILVPAAPDWFNVIKLIPENRLDLFLWSAKTAAFYLVAIFAALKLRNTFIAQRSWFSLNNLERSRPYIRYFWPVVAGTVSGYLCLVLIIFNDMELNLAQAGQQFLTATELAGHWAPLATIVSWLTLFICDTDHKYLSRMKIIRRSLAGGLAMGVTGYGLNFILAQETVTKIASMGNEKLAVAHYLSFAFLAALIFIFSTLLFGVVGYIEKNFQQKKDLSGKAIHVKKENDPFTIKFSSKKLVHLFKGDAQQTYGAACCTGSWIQYPAGTLIKWDTTEHLELAKIGKLGLVLGANDCTRYEGFMEATLGPRAEYIANIDVWEEA